MKLPNARRERLLIEELAEETLIYDLDANKAHCLNASAALVWRNCDGRKSVQEVAGIISRELSVPESEDLILLALARLETAKLLSDYVPMAGVTRRAVLKQLALTMRMTALLPVVHSIVAPTPAQAQTCINPGGSPPGAICVVNSNCCSNVCDVLTLRCL